jgi:hypothetical protein
MRTPLTRNIVPFTIAVRAAFVLRREQHILDLEKASLEKHEVELFVENLAKTQTGTELAVPGRLIAGAVCALKAGHVE